MSAGEGHGPPPISLWEAALLFRELVEVEVEFEDVDAGFAEQAQLAGGDVPLDELADLGFAEVAGLGDAGSLEGCGVRGDVGVEAGGRGGDQVDGDGLAGVLLGELVDGALDAIDEDLAGLSQVGAAGSGSVIARASGRGPGMEVTLGGEALGEQLGADNLAVLEDEAAGGLGREDQAADAGDQERIAQAQQDRGDEGETD